MTEEQSGEGATVSPGDDTQSREEEKNQPEYLGDKVDSAVKRMEEEGEPMSPQARELVEKGKEAIDRAARGADE